MQVNETSTATPAAAQVAAPAPAPASAAATAAARTSRRRLSNKQLGAKGEELARLYLERRGWEILQQNWRALSGEVDIVAKDTEEDPGIVVLCEVKTRRSLSSEDPELPELAVDQKKTEKYRRLALEYLANHPELESLRFDVIAITVISEEQARLRHLFGAFWWDA